MLSIKPCQRFNNCLLINYTEYNKRHSVPKRKTTELSLVDAAVMARRAELSKGNAKFEKEGQRACQ